MSTKANKPKFSAEKILINGKKITKTAKKVKISNEAVAIFKSKEGKLNEEDKTELERRKAEREKNNQ